MTTFLLVFHVIICTVLVFVVLIQSGKDGGIGMMSGGGTSQSVFGSSGGANFFTKFTSATAALFMLTSIGLTVTKSGKRQSVFDGAPSQSASAPAIPVTPAQPTVPVPNTPAAKEATPATK